MAARLAAVVVAFAVGWGVYMVGMVLTVYDGLLSLIFQPFMAALWSTLFVGLSLVAGLVLRIPPLKRWWTGSRVWACSLAAASLCVLVFGYSLGLTYMGVHPELGHEVKILHPLAALGGYAGLIFALANWPLRSNLEPRGRGA